MHRKGIIGLGSDLRGDDGVGHSVVAYLERSDIGDIDLIYGGTGGMRLIHDLSELDRAVIIDAAKMGLEPGGYRIFTPDQAVKVESFRASNQHEWDLFRSLEVLKLTGEEEKKVLIMGVEPYTMDLGEGLSEGIRERIPEYACEALRAIDESN